MKLRVSLVCLAALICSWMFSGLLAHADSDPPASPDVNGGAGSGSSGVSAPDVETPAQTGSSVPRIMLTAFSTEPGVVKAGEAFRVSFTVQNMSTSSRVNNIKVTVSGGDAGGILPASGSSSTYISTIRPEYSVSREMDFRTIAALEEGPHQLTLTIEYEDGSFNQLQSQETVSILVEQETRADTGSVQVLPDYVVVGQDASLTFSVNNLGKTQLFNARAAVKEDQAVTGQESFIGTIEPGASGAVDLLVHAEAENYEPVVVVVSYENANGEVTSLERTFELIVEQPMEESEEFYPEEPMPEDVSAIWSPSTLVIIGALVLLALLVIILVVRGRKRRARAALNDDMALLDGDPLVPTDPS